MLGLPMSVFLQTRWAAHVRGAAILRLACTPSSRLDMKLTAVFQKVREGYIGFVEELPGANTQARTLKQARANLAEAVELVLQANRSLSKKSIGKKKVIREPLVLAIE